MKFHYSTTKNFKYLLVVLSVAIVQCQNLIRLLQNESSRFYLAFWMVFTAKKKFPKYRYYFDIHFLYRYFRYLCYIDNIDIDIDIITPLACLQSCPHICTFGLCTIREPFGSHVSTSLHTNSFLGLPELGVYKIWP